MPGKSGSHYDSEAAGWAEFGQPEDTLWYEVPQGTSIRDHVDPSKVEAIWVHAFDSEGDDHWFWVRSYMPLDWEQWDNLIETVMDMHNMSMA